MNKTLLLTKIELINLFANSQFRSSRKGKKAVGIAMFVLPAGLMLYISVVYSMALMSTLPTESRFLMPVLLSIGSFAMLFSLSFYNASGHLFGFKDFDLLMSLPLSEKDIMISKLTAFLLMDYFFSIFLVGPFVVIYGVGTGQGILYYLIGLIGFLCLPLIPMALSSVLSLLIAKFSGQSKYRTLIRNVLSLIMIGLLLVGSMFMQNLMFLNATDAQALFNNIQRYLPPVYYFVKALLDANFAALLVFVLMNVSFFVIFVLLFSKMFTRLNDRFDIGYKEKNYVLKTQKGSSKFIALLRLQAQRYFGSTPYLINTIVGPVMPIIFIVIGAVNGVDAVKSYMNMFDQGGYLLPILSVAIMFTSSMCMITACSISLEGRNIGILKSSPISVSTIFGAKIALQVLVTCSCLALAVLSGIVLYDLSWFDGAILMIVSIVSSLLFAVLGLVINLNFPKMEWDSEILVVKQSMSVIIAVFGGMGICVLHAAAYLFFGWPFGVFLIGALLLDLLIILGMWYYLVTIGKRQFYRL